MSEKDLNRQATEADLENISGGRKENLGWGAYNVTVGNTTVSLGKTSGETKANAVQAALYTIGAKNAGLKVNGNDYSDAASILKNYNVDLDSVSLS